MKVPLHVSPEWESLNLADEGAFGKLSLVDGVVIGQRKLVRRIGSYDDEFVFIFAFIDRLEVDLPASTESLSGSTAHS